MVFLWNESFQSHFFGLTGLRGFVKGMDNLIKLGQVKNGKKESHTQTTAERTG